MTFSYSLSVLIKHIIALDPCITKSAIPIKRSHTNYLVGRLFDIELASPKQRSSIMLPPHTLTESKFPPPTSREKNP